MSQRTKDEVISEMVIRAVIAVDNGGLFQGSPRPFMEVPGESVSSGKLYNDLKAVGVMRLSGRGKNAIWYIPPEYMERYSSRN